MKDSPFSVLRSVPLILLTAGHGALDSGAVAGKFTERERAIQLTDLTAALLRSVLGDSAVLVTPHGDDTHDSIAWINKRYGWGKAWALELHSDSSEDVKGEDADLRCGIYHGPSSDSTAVAQEVAKTFITYGAHKRTWARPMTEHRARSLGWIRQLRCFSHLIELGFMEGRNDDAHLARLARVAAGGIARAFSGKLYQFPAA